MSKAPWILLRGLMRDARHWGGFPSAFAAAVAPAGVQVIDLPGNGSRVAGTSPATVPDMADWLRRELRAMGLAPPYRVLALSLGAMVTVAWAERHAEEIEAAVLVNTSLKPLSPFHRRLRPAAWPLLLRLMLTRPEASEVERVILQLTSTRFAASNGLRELWTAWRLAQPVSRTNAMHQLLAAMRFRASRTPPRVPMLLLRGSRDRLVDPRCSADLAAAWNLPLLTHPDGGHDLVLDDPRWVIEQISSWLRDSISDSNPATSSR